jgi:hypothetical protein
VRLLGGFSNIEFPHDLSFGPEFATNSEFSELDPTAAINIENKDIKYKYNLSPADRCKAGSRNVVYVVYRAYLMQWIIMSNRHNTGRPKWINYCHKS